jgi:hypothetical protein
MTENTLNEDRPDGGMIRRQIFQSVLAETSEDISAENLRRGRMGLPPKPKPLFPSTPVYVGIERAMVLGSDQRFEGKVFIVEPDGRLKPIDGKDLVALHRDFPNFVRQWKIPELD